MKEEEALSKLTIHWTTTFACLSATNCIPNIPQVAPLSELS